MRPHDPGPEAMRKGKGPRQWWLGLGPAMWAFVALFAGLPWVLTAALDSHASQESLRIARSINTVVTVVRSYYTRNVVQRIQDGGGSVAVTDRYHDIQGAIPIPATLSIELGEALSLIRHDSFFGMQFVSDRPFLNRARRPLDAFESEALRHFRQDRQDDETAQREGFWRIGQELDRRTTLRMAVPVRMEPGCVACHNAHPDSPVRDWKVGDVRGIQEVTVEINPDVQAGDSAWLVMYLLLFGGSGLLALREHRGAVAAMRRLNGEVEASRQTLVQKSQVLEGSIRDLTTKTAVLDRAPFGVLVMDPKADDLPLTFVNDAFCEMTGYASEEVLGRHPRFLFGPDTRAEALEDAERAVRQRQSRQFELAAYTRGGQPRQTRWLVFPTFGPDDELLTIVACVTDITEITEAQRERQRLEAELQESSKLEFLSLTIAGMAHDLNTPIGIAVTASTEAARTATELAGTLQEEAPDLDAARAQGRRIQRSAELVSRNLAKAAQLVNSFKRTTADVTRHEWRMVDLRELLDSLRQALSPMMKRAECRVELQCPQRLSLYTEPGSIAQAVTNLMVNATLHAFEGREHRELRIVVEDAGDTVRIQVADNGSGMTEEAAMKAFTPFFTTRRAAGGSGLGLFSSRRAIEQGLGGRLTFESRAGQGTTFLIELPRLRPGQVPPHDTPGNPA